MYAGGQKAEDVWPRHRIESCRMRQRGPSGTRNAGGIVQKSQLRNESGRLGILHHRLHVHI